MLDTLGCCSGSVQLSETNNQNYIAFESFNDLANQKSNKTQHIYKITGD